jgi:uncharacterized protein (TIGR00730 family)
MKKVCVYCGSNPGVNGIYAEEARRLGNTLVQYNLELVYGGAEVGLMGEVANAVLKAGGKVIGVLPQAFADKVSHRGLTELHLADSMHARKQMMFDLSDAFIALPGGFGTIEEFTELLTWAQLGFHAKPCGLMNVCGYYNPFLSFLDHAVSQGFIKQAHREMVFASEEPSALLEHFRSYVAPKTEKWIMVPSRE